MSPPLDEDHQYGRPYQPKPSPSPPIMYPAGYGSLDYNIRMTISPRVLSSIGVACCLNHVIVLISRHFVVHSIDRMCWCFAPLVLLKYRRFVLLCPVHMPRVLFEVIYRAITFSKKVYLGTGRRLHETLIYSITLFLFIVFTITTWYLLVTLEYTPPQKYN